MAKITDDTEDYPKIPTIAPEGPFSPALIPMGASADMSLARPAASATPKKAAQNAGQAQYRVDMPQVTAAPGTSSYGQQNQARLDYEKMHPWGSPVSAHPGTWGKIGHVLGRIGNYAGEALAPRLTEEIPGTDLNREMQTAQNQEWIKMGQPEELESEREKSTENLETNKEQQASDAEAKREQAAKDIETQRENAQAGIEKGRESTALQVAGLKTDEKIPPHVTLQGPDGKPHIMERDSKTGQYSVDRGVAPASYAQSVLPTRTTELLGPDNVMHRYQYNPSTGRYDMDMGAAPTGTAAHQIFQAGAIENLGPQVIKDIDANRDILGNLSSYYKQWLAGTPVSDPRAAALMTELMSFAAMQPALHAFRSTNAMEAFEKMVGGLAKNPDSTIATINALLKTPESFTNMVRPNAAGQKNENAGQSQGKGPAVGEVRTINGQKAKWDGKGWLPQ